MTKAAALTLHGIRGRRMVLSVAVLTVLYLFAAAMTPAKSATSKPQAAGASCFQTAGLPSGSAVVGIAVTPDDGGYWVVANDGYVAACGDASYLGEQTTLNAPIVGIAATPDGGGYYLVASDGGIFAFGDAQFQGSTGSIKLNRPVVGMTVDPVTGGYRLVASDGGIFSYDAPFLGSTGSMTLNKPVVGMADSGNGSGYWLVAADGGIFAYGVPFWGSTGSMHLNKPVVGMAADAASGGYWLVASDGGIFAYHAPFYGSTGSITLNKPIVGMEANATASGYRFVAADGGVFSYGSSKFYGTPTSGSAPGSGPASSANCTNPSFSTSEASGTENTDPADGEFWWVDNDAWSGSHGPQTIYVCNQSSWYATSNQTNNGGQVETYPDTEYDVGGRDNPSTKPISGWNSISSTFSEAYPTTGTSFDAAYDLWTDNWTNETMIWNQWDGTDDYWGQCAEPGTDQNDCVGSGGAEKDSVAVTLGGVAYHFLALGSNCSPSTEANCEYIFFRDSQVASGSVNILAAWQWEVANGYASASDVPTQLCYGVEIIATTGTQTFPTTGLTFDVS